jgi:hypothetical protein
MWGLNRSNEDKTKEQAKMWLAEKNTGQKMKSPNFAAFICELTNLGAVRPGLDESPPLRSPV